MTNKNNLPTYFEELRLDSESTISIQGIISQLKQQIPADYLEIIAEEGNYCGSTNPKWKDKPLSERYGFTHEGEWIQIDIPRSIMEKLGLDKNKEDKDISQPFYLNPQVLTRKETYKGINIENEEEIILVNPHKIVVKDLGIQTELDNKKLEKTETELEREKEKNNKLNSEVIQLKADLVKAQQEKQNLQNTINSLIIENNQISDLNSTIANLQQTIKDKDDEISNLKSTISGKDRELAQKDNQITSLNSQVSSLKVEVNNSQNYKKRMNETWEILNRLSNFVQGSSWSYIKQEYQTHIDLELHKAMTKSYVD